MDCGIRIVKIFASP